MPDCRAGVSGLIFLLYLLLAPGCAHAGFWTCRRGRLLFRRPDSDCSLPKQTGCLRGIRSEAAIQADAQGRLYPEYNGPVGRFQFLLRVLLIAALFAALLQLARGAGQGIETWEMRLGIVLFAFVWIYSVEGRVMDAGLPRWLSIVYCLILPGVCVLPRFLNIISLHVALALFVVLQIPTILFRSRTVYAGPVGLNDSGQEAHGLRVVGKDKPVRQGVRLDGIEFAVYTLLIAGLWYVLHLLRGDAGFGTMSLAVCLALDAGSMFLGILWSICVSGRLRDADLHDWTVEFCLVVFAASVLPLAFGVIEFPVALVVFAVLQAPAVFIRHGSVSAKFSSG